MSNPFATRFTRPGALGYLFPPGQSAVGMLDFLRNNGWWGEIIGPHGSGKSSLVAELLPLLEATGRRVAIYSLHQGDRTIPISKADVAAWNEETQVVVDGYEQLSWWSKRRLQSQVKSRQAGLLITAHQPMGLPPLFVTEPTLALARQIVAELVKSDPNQTLTDAEVAAAFTAHGANLREMLFSLYDVYQRRQNANDQ
jgi:energy-coupling factor transporter ATP-binding protein EcfA2